ncbi:hypothetical protein [Amycolatopsis orientalis]|uniref:hypothetical protein n=1 Tax=Amycolatopsis orientalis TaxID=31958 RepID=UPI0012697222|nr:hypothetical protein [Amycolatopsis orientalis]
MATDSGISVDRSGMERSAEAIMASPEFQERSPVITSRWTAVGVRGGPFGGSRFASTDSRVR